MQPTGQRHGGVLPGIRFAGIGDEAAARLADQIEAVRRLGWNALELRTVEGRPIAEVDDDEFDRIARALDVAGCEVTCLDSRIAGWGRPISTPVDADVDELAVLARRAAILGTRNVRIMSYPNDGLDEESWRRETFARMRRLVAQAETAGLVLLMENCSGWAATSAERMVELVEEFDSESLRLLFDAGNGVAYGYSAYELLGDVVQHVAYVHVKDATGTAEEPVYMLPGHGTVQLADSLRLLVDRGYQGVWSIEPHLRVRPHEHQLDAGSGGVQLFVEYGREFERFCARAVAPRPAVPAQPAPASRPVTAVHESFARVPFSGSDCDLLLHLLGLPTVGPLESGECSTRLWEAQHAYVEAATEIGMRVVHHAPADRSEVVGAMTPRATLDAMKELPGFLGCQPNLVLRLGPELPRSATVMFNVHMDTVAGWEQPSFSDGRFSGRGAIDAKGPAVALLAGIRAAAAAVPALGSTVSVLVQVVSGEESGAMGFFGTRPLVQRGHVGRLNIFCEPTGGRLLTRASAAMTPCVTVRGEDAIDDDPGAGHNATVLLGFLAQHLAGELSKLPADGRACVAGLHTGDFHNRVYGTGRLLFNLSYGSVETARALESTFTTALALGLDEFADRFGGIDMLAMTARDVQRITRLEWLKRGLPALNNSDPALEALLTGPAGLNRWPDSEPGFTCDAIWMHDQPGAFTAVLGPGDLAANNAHAEGEFAELADLEGFAGDVARLLAVFARHHSETETPTDVTTEDV